MREHAPWTVREGSDRASPYWEVWGRLGIDNGPSLIIATVRSSLVAARLIAAAPAMLASIRDMIRQLAEVSAGETPGYSLGPEERIWFDSARALVARIEGKG